jgi:hypothetical protein
MVEVTKDVPESTETRFAVRLASGWFVVANGLLAREDAAMHKRWSTTTRLLAAHLADVVPGGEQELVFDALSETVVRYVSPTTGAISGPSPWWNVRVVVVCGVGPSGTPSCFSPLATDPTGPDQPIPPAPRPQLEGDGSLTAVGTGGATATTKTFVFP